MISQDSLTISPMRHQRYMRSYFILSNNPLVHVKYPAQTLFFDAGVSELLIAARDKVHLGAKLLNHPLSGGVLPGVSPYKSLIITATDSVKAAETDFTSLDLIERAIRALKKPPEGFAGYDERTLEDFRVLDLDVLESALGAEAIQTPG